MTRTPSGAISSGAPHSLARINEECNHAIENSLNLLLLTSEGRYVLEMFALATDCNYLKMTEHDQEQPGFISEWLNKESEKLRIFMRGLMTRWTCIQ